MKKLRLDTIFTLFLVLFIISTYTASAFGKDFKFQSSLIRDCRVYEELYEGIDCRNASFEDVPICEDGEEIITSPRRTKLCCCVRVREDGVEDVKEGGKPATGGDCRDVGCVNPEKTDSKGVVCNEDKVPLLFDGGTATCCCAKDRATLCQKIGCSEVGGSEKVGIKSFCKEGFSQSVVTHEAEGESLKLGCCCPSGDKQASSSFTCSLFQGCEVAEGGTKGECPADLRNFTTKLDIGDDGVAETTLSCCCKSVSKSDIKTKK